MDTVLSLPELIDLIDRIASGEDQIADNPVDTLDCIRDLILAYKKE